jgi:hypothetical protein
MGHHLDGDEGPAEHVPSSIAALTPAPGGRHGHVHDEEHEEPAVVEQQRAIEEHFAAPPPEEAAIPQEEEAPLELDQPVEGREPAPVVAIRRVPRPVAVAPIEPVSRASGAKAKAAFTLRLDPDRHLKLRLACAVTGRSAQQLVTGALDELLASLPEIESLARQLPEAGKRAG